MTDADMTALTTVNYLRCPGCGHNILLPLLDGFQPTADGLQGDQECSRCYTRVTLRLIVVGHTHPNRKDTHIHA